MSAPPPANPSGGSPAPRGRIPVGGPADARDLDGDFSHRMAVLVRFADTDAMAHVNNAVYLTYAESARIGWWMAATGEPLERDPGRREGLILAEAEIAFRSPVLFGETVTIESRGTRIGRSSLGLEHRLTAGRPGATPRLVAVCRSVLVRYDYVAGTATPWPADLVERVEAYEGRVLRG